MISVHHSNHSTFESLHVSSILRHCRRPENRKFVESKLDAAVKYYFSPLITTYEELLSAKPQELFALKQMYDGFGVTKKENLNKKLGAQGLYTRFKQNREAFVKADGSIYNSAYLAQQLDILTCSYCNENYTYTYEHVTRGHSLRSYDWDHIIPQAKYPFLAISFYNLIPACKVCNNLKLDTTIEISPFEDFNVDSYFKFKAQADKEEFLKDTKSIKLSLLISTDDIGQKLEHAIKLVAMDSRYSSQKELIRDLLNKKSLFGSAYWTNMKSNILKAGKLNEGQLNQVFWGVYFNHQNYFKRPYSKLVKDILS